MLVESLRDEELYAAKLNANTKGDDSAYTELHILRKCAPHPNILKIKEAFWDARTKGLVLVTEYQAFGSLNH